MKTGHPGHPAAEQGLVSLVITSRTGGAALFDCIESFQGGGDAGLEIVVTACGDVDATEAIRGRFPDVRVIHCPTRRSIPELRAAGLLASRGDIVAMTEDHCVAGDGWLMAVRQAHAGPAAAVGGALENRSSGRIVDWAVFFCEYGRFMPPIHRGSQVDLPGTNVSYKRSAIDAFRDLLDPPAWETLWHWRLTTRGLLLAQEPSVLVYHTRRYAWRSFLMERYRYARSFAAQRIAGRPWPVRLAFAAGTPCLPALVLTRVAWRVLPKRRHALQFVLSLPFVMVFAIACAVGEAVGYVAGPDGSAGQHG